MARPVASRLDRENPDCGQCGAPFYRNVKSPTTGYGIRSRDGMRICFACCGDNDRADMIRDGKATLYLIADRKSSAGYAVTNWPGSLRMPCFGASPFRHPWASRHTPGVSVDFVGPDRLMWHGRNCADHDIIHVKRYAAKAQRNFARHYPGLNLSV